MKRIINLSETDFLLLSSLLDGAAHGYELCRRFQGQVSRSQAYHSLAKLHGKGLLEMHEQVMVNAPSRQVYSVPARQRNRIFHLLEEFMGHVSRQAGEGLRQYHLSQDSAEKLQDIALRLLRASGSQFRTHFE